MIEFNFKLLDAIASRKNKSVSETYEFRETWLDFWYVQNSLFQHVFLLSFLPPRISLLKILHFSNFFLKSNVLTALNFMVLESF
jgi:hypothetical protein